MSDDIEAFLVRIGVIKPPTPEEAAKEAVRKLMLWCNNYFSKEVKNE